MTRFPILLALSLALALPTAAAAGEDEATEEKTEAKKAKKKTVIDFSETPCEGADCTVVGEVHEPRVQYIITRQGIQRESTDAAMDREEADLKRAAAGTKKAKKKTD